MARSTKTFSKCMGGFRGLFEIYNKEVSFPNFQCDPFHIAETKRINEYFYRQYRLSVDELRCEFSIVRLLEPIYYLVVHIISIFPAFQDNVDKKEIIDGYVAKWLNNIEKIVMRYDSQIF